jgi:adenosylcobinamide-phosphate synthase
LAAAAFWFALLGLPGLVLYRTIAVMGREFDETQPCDHLFSLTPTRLFEAVAWLLVRLAVLLIAIAAVFVQGTRPGTAVEAMTGGTWGPCRTRGGLASRGACRSARPLPSRAPASGSGRRRVGAMDRTSRWRAKVTALDVRRALFLYVVARLLNAALAIVVTMAWLTV